MMLGILTGAALASIAAAPKGAGPAQAAPRTWKTPSGITELKSSLKKADPSARAKGIALYLESVRKKGDDVSQDEDLIALALESIPWQKFQKEKCPTYKARLVSVLNPRAENAAELEPAHPAVAEALEVFRLACPEK